MTGKKEPVILPLGWPAKGETGHVHGYILGRWAIASGVLRTIPLSLRAFALMTLMHSQQLADHEVDAKEFAVRSEAYGNDRTARVPPRRNAVLERTTTDLRALPTCEAAIVAQALRPGDAALRWP